MNKKMIIKLILIFIFLISCVQQKDTNPDDLYIIKSEKEHVDPQFGYNKCNLTIELKEKVSEELLIKIAKSLRLTRANYDKLFIGYYLPGMDINGFAWAVTNFTPILDVDIIGTTIEEESIIKDSSINVDGEILGKFYTDLNNSSFIIYEKNNKTFIRNKFSDGSFGDYEVRKTIVNNGVRLKYLVDRSQQGEYFILTKSGELEFYNRKNEKFATAIKF